MTKSFETNISDYVLTRTSIFGNTNSMTFPGELMDQIEEWLDTPRTQRLKVQDAFPQLGLEHREFLITGITPGEWDSIFGDEDEQ